MLAQSRKVLVLGKISEAGIDRLRAAGGYTIVERPNDPDDLYEQARDAAAIIVRTTPIDRDLLAAAPELGLVARHGVGYDAVDVAACTERGIPLALVGDVNSTAVAEHTLALMLALAKRIPMYERAIRSDNYAIRDSFAATELRGRTVLIVGFGRIGRQVAKLCDAFGMKIVAADPFADAAGVAAMGYRHVADFREALGDADYVNIHAPKLPETRHLIGAAELAGMKRDAYLINVARGGMVDEAALLAALDSGGIGGAGLDVLEHEPLPGDDPLVGRDDIVISPHCAALTAECSRRMAVACAENVIAFFAGTMDRALVVNPEVLEPV